MGPNLRKTISYAFLIMSTLVYAAYALGFYAMSVSHTKGPAGDVFERTRDLGEIPALRDMLGNAGK